ncbi:MAG: outer membrane beta-barrel protein [Bacteroidetes bacterium]|nr:outer membrane beta-barrel protein [Bacteroidota bacterium]MBP6649720.1 outer membrane beta-barrel protein [Bacteroidia bacterium]
MIHRLLLCFSLFVLSVPVIAQEQRGMMGAGLSAGASNYAGELDDNFTLIFTRPGFGAHINFLFFSRVHIRLAAFHGRITASDANGVNLSGNQYRNLSFYSDIDEAGIHFMYKLQSRKKGFTKRNRIAPYVFIGFAYFQFNPKRELNGKTYELQKVGTEGQYLQGAYPKPYSLKQFSIPVGLGFMLKITDHLDVGTEIGFRKTFTDYLDDVSTKYPDKQQMLAEQGPDAAYLADPSNDPEVPGGKINFSKRGNSKNLDWYVYTNVHFTYYFTTALFKAYKPTNKFRGDTCKGLIF